MKSERHSNSVGDTTSDHDDANDEKLGRMLAKHVAIFMAEIE